MPYIPTGSQRTTTQSTRNKADAFARVSIIDTKGEAFRLQDRNGNDLGLTANRVVHASIINKQADYLLELKEWNKELDKLRMSANNAIKPAELTKAEKALDKHTKAMPPVPVITAQIEVFIPALQTVEVEVPQF